MGFLGVRAGSLSNKTVVITGASAGLGATLAVECAQQGARLVLLARNANYWRSWRLWSPRPGFISCATTGSWPPRVRDRGRIVPAKPVEESTAADRASSAPPCAHRLRWATLLARVFSSDLSTCATCGGHLRIVAALTDPASIRTYLEGVGLPAVPPPQPQFEFVA